MSNIMQLIKLYQSHNQQERQQAVLELENTMFSNTTEFYTEIVKIIVNQNESIINRNQATVLMSQSVVKQIPTQNNMYLWSKIEINLQDQIKVAILAQLQNENMQFKRVISQLISQIALIDIPLNRWNSLLDALAKVISNNEIANQQHKITSIMALGYIAEEFQDKKISGLNEQQQQTILTCICLGLNQDNNNTIEIKLQSIRALNFLSQLLNHQNFRDSTLKYILELFNDNNENLAVEAIQTLIEFAKFNYEHLQNYIEKLFQFLSQPLKSKREVFVVPTIEVFETIYQEYLIRINSGKQAQDYLQPYFQQLQQSMMENLLENTQNDDIISGIQAAAERALVSVINIYKENCINDFQSFLSNTINNQQYNFRQASCLAYGVLVEGFGEDSQQLEIIQSPLLLYIALMNDHDMKVQETAAKTMNKLAENYPQYLTENTQVEQIIQVFWNSLRKTPTISYQISSIFNNIAYYLKGLDTPSKSLFFKFIPQTLDLLYQNGIRSDFQTNDGSVIEVTFMAMMDLLHYAKDASLCVQWLQRLVKDFEQSYQIVDNRKNYIQCGILSVIHGTILGLAFETSLNNSQAVMQIFELIKNYFSSIKDVTTDGLYVISALLSAAKEVCMPLIDQSYAYVQHGLNSNQPDLMKSCLQTLGDMARLCGQSFEDKIEVIIVLIKYIENTEISGNVKLHVVNCVGDLCLGNKQSKKYIDQLMVMYNKTFNAVIQILESKTTNSQLLQYTEDLQYALLDSYTCFTHGMSDTEDPYIRQKLVNNADLLFKFIQVTSNKEINPTLEFIRFCVNILSDYAQLFSELGPRIKENKQLDYLVTTLINFQHKNQHKQITPAYQDNKSCIEYGQNTLAGLNRK